MKQLQLYAEDGVRGKIAHGSAHVIGGLPRQPEDQMGYDFDAPRVKRGYCLLILGEGKTTAYKTQGVFMDSLKTEFDPDRFYGI